MCDGASTVHLPSQEEEDVYFFSCFNLTTGTVGQTGERLVGPAVTSTEFGGV